MAERANHEVQHEAGVEDFLVARDRVPGGRSDQAADGEDTAVSRASWSGPHCTWIMARIVVRICLAS